MSAPLDVILIGLGRSAAGYGIGTFVAREFLNHPGARLRAVVGRNVTRLEILVGALNERADVSTKFAGDLVSVERFEEYLAGSSAQLVAVCSPDNTHGHYVDCALRRRKHVFVEKPFIGRATQLVDEDAVLAESLAARALENRLALITNCQRNTLLPIIFEKFGGPGNAQELVIEVHIGARGRKRSARELPGFLLAHPLAILYALGLREEGLAVENVRVDERADSTAVAVYGYARISGKDMRTTIVLSQRADCAHSHMVLRWSDLALRVTALPDADGRMYTRIESLTDTRSYRASDALTLQIGRVVRIIASNDARQISASAHESLALYKMQRYVEQRLVALRGEHSTATLDTSV